MSQPRPDPTPVLPRAARAGRVVEAFLLFALIPGLLFVTCEHALYGCLLFTIGLGGFLMEGVR